MRRFEKMSGEELKTVLPLNIVREETLPRPGCTLCPYGAVKEMVTYELKVDIAERLYKNGKWATRIAYIGPEPYGTLYETLSTVSERSARIAMCLLLVRARKLGQITSADFAGDPKYDN
jgi:hypothetical protein